ncbi:MAG: GAF domain-containing protein [Chloroflexi bacterium]|nr:MAG: GAF domain-containing protein [Chloroflexota bacterium]
MPMDSWFRSNVLSRLAGRKQPPEQPAASTADTNELIRIGQEIYSSQFERLDLETFAQRIAESLQRHLPAIEHLQIYIISGDGQRAVLRAATGAVGQKLLEREYQVDVGGLSVVGRVALNRHDLLLPDFAQEQIHKPHALLADMRTEFAIPLMVNDRVIGVLDTYSTRPGAFSAGDITLLRAVAVQLTMALDSLQLYDEAQRSLRENQALFQQTQSNLREIERLNYQLTGRAWSEYLRLQSDSTAMMLDLDSGQITPDAEWTPTLHEAAAHRQVITIIQDGERRVALPITVRNEVIGAMEFELDADSTLPEGVLELCEAVGQRLGLAMETRRLFDETQRAVQREGLINDINSDLQAATGVDVILQRAAQHLSDALNARQVSIRLGTPADNAQRKA